MVTGNGEKATDPVAAVKRSYEHGVTDEFIEPVTIVDERNEPVGLIREDDACIFFNYRADRGPRDDAGAYRRRTALKTCTSPP